MPYVNIITYYVKSLGSLSLKYEMLQIVVKYNLGSIAKMGYMDPNNSGKFVKVFVVIDDDDEEEEENAPPEGQARDAPVQDPTAPTLADIMGALTLMREDFDSFKGEVRSRLDTMAEQITSVDHKIDLGANFNEPQIHPSFDQLSEATN